MTATDSTLKKVSLADGDDSTLLEPGAVRYNGDVGDPRSVLIFGKDT